MERLFYIFVLFLNLTLVSSQFFYCGHGYNLTLAQSNSSYLVGPYVYKNVSDFHTEILSFTNPDIITSDRSHTYTVASTNCYHITFSNLVGLVTCYRQPPIINTAYLSYCFSVQ